MGKLNLTAKERVLSRITIDPESGCWLWTGGITAKGYGVIRFANKTREAYRLSYEVLVGPIPAGMHLDHTCHDPKTCTLNELCPHRRCVNPAHLEPVTKHENMARSGILAARIRQQTGKTHCPKGHEYTPENTKVKNGCRNCKACDSARHMVKWRLQRQPPVAAVPDSTR